LKCLKQNMSEEVCQWSLPMTPEMATQLGSCPSSFLFVVGLVLTVTKKNARNHHHPNNHQQTTTNPFSS